MDVTEILTETFNRIPSLAENAVEGLSVEQLVESPGHGANTVAWLVWHIARVQDAQIADVAGREQLWVTGDWAGRFGREPDPSDTGYGDDFDRAQSLRPDDPNALIDHLEAVHEVTVDYVSSLEASDLDRVIDENWDPPVTLGVRLVSIADDCLQHAGQASYLKGLLVAE